ncbi:MAG: type II toxin-antitoxin system PemK/MazF family toxin [Chloroflexi bacterium]|nr:type II toxin-antitoxin system PemK/MazF family toxin [Chloroflexota bacterium]MBU1750772.1 type II toxin-antitoxin system PemK/MazF family toxin [Chloroflexota bacterium]
MPVERGEVYWVEFDPVKGSEQGGLRPALVVQNDVGNHYSPTTVVVAVTRTLPPRPYPFIVVLEPGEGGLSELSVINCAQIATIQQSGLGSRLRPRPGESDMRPIGRLSPERIAEVDEALRYNLALKG